MNTNQVVRTKNVPSNNDAEMYVLGCVLLENDIINQLVGKLSPEDFYNQKHQKIFQAMLDLNKNEEQIEILTISEQLVRNKVTNIDEYKKYLVELLDMIPSVSSVDIYLNIVEEKALERKILANMQTLSDDILTSKYEFNEILDKAEDLILNAIKKRRTTEFMTVGEAAQIVYEQIEHYAGNNSGITGLNTGYENLNKATLGFQNGDLMILAARPSVGKSTFALNLALNIAEFNANKHVAIFSLEMSIEQLLPRIFSKIANIPLSRIRSGDLSSEDLLLLSLAKQELVKYNLYFDVNSSTNVAEIRAKCRQLKQADHLDFVIIDYLQLVTSSDTRGNRQEEVSKISRELKKLARELDVPILALSQLSRSIEAREDKRPVLADLRESGSIEQDADLVMFLYKRSDVEENNDDASTVKTEEDAKVEDENKLTTIDTNTENRDAYQEIILSIAKNRQGPLDYIDFHFYGALSRFKEQKDKKPIILKKKRSARTKQLN